MFDCNTLLAQQQKTPILDYAVKKTTDNVVMFQVEKFKNILRNSIYQKFRSVNNL